MTTNAACTLDTFAFAPWGDGPGEVALTVDDFPRFGEMEPGQVRQVRAPMRIRLDSLGGLHALADGSLRTSNQTGVFIHHFEAQGQIVAKTPIDTATDHSFVLDYAVDADGAVYLLEQIEPVASGEPRNRLRKVDQGGQTAWSRTGPVSDEEFDLHELQGAFKRLLMDGDSRLYLPATEQAGAIAEIDRNTGNTLRVYTCDKFSGQVFMNDRGTAVFVLYFPDLNRRGLGFWELAEPQVSSVVGGTELYGWLIYPIGVDASSNVYAWKDSSLASISPDGRVEVIAAIDNLVTRSQDGVTYASHQRSDHGQPVVVQVTGYSPAGETDRQDLYLPENLTGRGWKLIQVDEAGKFYLFGGEAPGQLGTLLVYSSDGKLETTMSPPPDLFPLESKLEGHTYWSVDRQGRIYLPVTDAQGFKVIRLSHQSQ